MSVTPVHHIGERREYRAWSDEEKERLRKYWTVDKLTVQKIGELLGRAHGSVNTQIHKMGLPSNGRGRSAKEDTLLAPLVPGASKLPKPDPTPIVSALLTPPTNVYAVVEDKTGVALHGIDKRGPYYDQYTKRSFYVSLPHLIFLGAHTHTRTPQQQTRINQLHILVQAHAHS